MSDNILRVIPLGGLGEVGKNMTVFEIADQLLVVDAGLAFPRDEHLGVDLILPDFGYLHDRDVLAVVLTHAHEDHVGGLPYLMREVPIREIWATRLTRPLGWLVPRGLRPIAASDVAAALVEAMKRGQPGTHLLSSADMQGAGD